MKRVCAFTASLHFRARTIFQGYVLLKAYTVSFFNLKRPEAAVQLLSPVRRVGFLGSRASGLFGSFGTDGKPNKTKGNPSETNETTDAAYIPTGGGG